ncbi:MAG TPA: PAS domain S-box protein [Pyrinomonadaceae bacterium]|jgi:PAS domain S-box-containing protein
MADNFNRTGNAGKKSALKRFHNLPFDETAASWLTAIIESAEDAIISKTLEGIITSWNKSAQRIFGYTAEEIIGKSVLTLIPPDMQHEEQVIIGKIKAGDRIEHYETIRVAKDGHLINISLTVSPIKALDGTIIGASKIVRDISARKQTEAKLKEQSEILETINRIGQLLSAELDQEKLVQAFTDAGTEITGAEFGAFFYNVYRPDGGSYMLYSLSGVPREHFENFPMPRATDIFGPTFRGEGTIRLDDVHQDSRYGKNAPYFGMPEGHLPVSSYLAVPVISRSNEVIGGLFFGHSSAGFFTEAHEQIIEGLAAQTAIAMDNARLYDQAQKAIKEREEALIREQEVRKQAEIASQSKDEFLGLLSHELRTPLNAILGWTRMLTSSQMDEATVANAIQTIDRNARLQARLIEDMLDVSRIMSGKLRLDTQPVDLTSVIHAAVDTLRPAAEAKEIRVYVVLDYGVGQVLGDSVRLQQITWNLLSNAIKFTPKQGSVKVFLERVNSHLELTVSDTGSGIEEEFLPYVFDRFRQADSSTTKKYGGLGLGLAIVKQLVELHGGTVEAANRKDESGAIFTVKLPLMVVRQGAEQRGRDLSRVHPVAGGGEIAFDCPPELTGIKILAIDDEPDARFLLTAILEKCGAEIKTCESATQAIDLLEEFQPDILISDIGMPEEDGYALIKRVRDAERGTSKRIPAVALTAFARVEDRLKALSAGFNMHVPKPVEPAELAMVIASLVGHVDFN